MQNKKSEKIFFYSIFILSFVLFVQILWPFATPLILAIILATVFHPLYVCLERLLKKRRALASIFSCVVICIIVIIPLGIFLGLLGKEALELVNWTESNVELAQLENYITGNTFINTKMELFNKAFNTELTVQKITEHLTSIAGKIGPYLYESSRLIGQNIFTLIFNFTLLFFILFYFFRDGKKIIRTLMDVSPLTDNHEHHLIKTFQRVSQGVVWGNVAGAALQGLVGGLAFLIFGLGNALLWGFAFAILSLIPAIGGMLIYVPATLYLYVTDGIIVALGFFLVNFIVSNLVDNILKPKLIESKMKAHPLLVFFSILGGVSVFGVLGLLYGPLIVIIFLTLLEMERTDFKL